MTIADFDLNPNGKQLTTVLRRVTEPVEEAPEETTSPARHSAAPRGTTSPVNHIKEYATTWRTS
jgi:hypothetical protein